jgi:hypothetical protein
VGTSLPAEPDARAARGEPRVKTFQLASLRADEAVCRAHVLDISRSGARVHCTADLRRGQQVTLMIEHLRIAATILWVAEQRAGLRFQTSLIDDQLRRIAALA